MGKWTRTSLGEVIELKRGYDLPQQTRRFGKVPIVSSSGITDYHDRPMVPGPGVITGRYGTLGQVFYTEDDFWPLNTTLYVRDFKGNDPRFISYFLRGLDFFAYSDKAAVPGLNRNDLHQAVVRFPANLDEQKAIAATLSALDDKIELNRRMNETLEAMARAIFKDWFVDFGPSRAKMEGCAPYLVPDLWALFPDKLDDEGMPEGWVEEHLLKHAYLLSGGTPRTEEPLYWNGSIGWASAKDISQCRDVFLINTERSITERGLNESSTKIIPKHATALVARGATTGRYCMFGNDLAMNQTCYALNSKYNRPFFVNCAFGFLVEALVFNAHGSVFDTITTKTIETATVNIPSDNLLDVFEELATPLFKQILANTNEAQTLSQTRDLLLPKLMSNEIRLRDAEKIVEAAA